MRMTDVFAVERGSFTDLAALARFHYAGGAPGVPARILRAMDRVRGELIGVLVVSSPPLNGAWRERAWPHLFGDAGSGRMSRRDAATALNRHVRTISRVIVEPRRRSMGVGAMLVRTYLGDALTPLTETIAAMGRYTSLFERCGMRVVECARSTRDYRLIDALAHEGIAPIDLVDPERAVELMRRAFVRDEVDRWLNAARGTRGLLSTARVERSAVAGRSIIARPVVYVHGEPGEGAHERADSGRAGAGGDCLLRVGGGAAAHPARAPAA